MDMILEALGEKEHSDRVRFAVYEGANHNEAQWRKRVPVFMEMFYGE